MLQPDMCVLCNVDYFETWSLEDIDRKEASKFFGARFACGSSVTSDDEIVIQGDVKDEVIDVLTEKWPQVRHWWPSYVTM